MNELSDKRRNSILPSFLHQKVRRLQKNLESLLELNPPEDLSAPYNFEPSTDLTHLKSMLSILPEDRVDALATIFSRMCIFFKGGLLLSLYQTADEGTGQKREVWCPLSAFKNGEYAPVPDALQQQAISLPAMQFGELRKTNPFAVLAPLQLEHLCDTPESAAFAIKPADEFLYLFFTELPEPWLKNHLQAIHQHILAATVDLPMESSPGAGGNEPSLG